MGIMVHLLLRLHKEENAGRLMMRMMMREGRGVKLVTTKRARRRIAIENAEKRKRIMKVKTERGVKFVMTKWVRRWIALGNAVLPALMKMMPNVIGNGAMHVKLVMTITILFNVVSVIDKSF